MTGISLQGRILHSGTASGEILLLDAPLSFWGGFDPATGTILDQQHPQAGESVGGKILALRETRGSAGTPAAIAEAIRRGCGPLAFLMVRPDVNVVTGVKVADHLYGETVPVVTIPEADFERLRNGMKMTISADGEIAAC